MKKKITCTVAKNHLFKYTFFIKTGSTWCALPLCLCMRYFITTPGEKSRDTWMLLRALSSRWPSVLLIIIYRYIYLQYFTSTGICTFTGTCISKSNLIKINCFETYTTAVEHQNPLLKRSHHNGTTFR